MCLGSGWVKPKILKLVCVASPLSTQHYGLRAKTGWLGTTIICISRVACLSLESVAVN